MSSVINCEHYGTALRAGVSFLEPSPDRHRFHEWQLCDKTGPSRT